MPGRFWGSMDWCGSTVEGRRLRCGIGSLGAERRNGWTVGSLGLLRHGQLGELLDEREVLEAGADGSGEWKADYASWFEKGGGQSRGEP